MLLGVAMLTLALVIAPTAGPAWAVSGAAFTTVDEAADGSGHCKNGNPAVNCNIYDGKEFVWLNGGPAANNLTDGDYFFAVLVPGGQNPDANDFTLSGEQFTNKNLSDDFDLYTNRRFTVSGGNVSAYYGTHDFDSGTPGSPKIDGLPPFIRLFPYADTTNPGGEYILAICSLADGYPVNPKNCKYDAFKVKTNVPPMEIDVTKFCDANANGLKDVGEIGLGLWDITFSPAPTDQCGGVLAAGTGTTNSSGNLVCVTTYLTTSQSISETVKPSFAHTATCVDSFCGTCSAHPAIGCNLATVAFDCPDFASGETCNLNGGLNPVTIDTTTGGLHDVAFGNVGLSTISGRKFSDLNANGSDDSEPGVQGVKVTLTGTAVNGSQVNRCAITGSNGTYSFTDLLPGTYTVSEAQPVGTIATTATSGQKTLTADGTTCEGTTENYKFGNACLGAGGGLTLGFWSNKNGQANLTGGTGGMTGALSFLSGLNLRNANGSNFDPTTYTQFRNWLLGATATNMAYMLSAQLTAMELNVRQGFVSGGSFVFAGTAPANCSVPGLSSLGFISISDLMNDANSGSNHSLATDSNTTAAAGDARTCQEFMKNALDKANNNLNFVVACPVFTATCP